ncbi:cytokine receptor family member B16 [Brienomyrus brachyistius]|uniref:cytokine receptor family member B16 n=1 Tax=Brienomyrus brachyistius TaxID=42636 RepID=UPI0020B1B116|nr:cytokine receptor family member B16 [Brienomyrus brachyistius]XP_048845595.1 cytokine receptor family member B16 [Brienomyrus brachyistius]XP_048845596.1 cytokine receptor family member B16 [Brienomyrus brachyistius]XP_048845597.1 cytokine receptor family member B16 [Brienomyrus brachyistius]XP_048845598.1 cytokine receptor family member B16 [Brienomyrus brachyistius]XP_048845599.1 cytokine receptor family member B16 [Brienomyrus brachyistius]XP_048845601.1 cytokine receptor family member 
MKHEIGISNKSCRSRQRIRSNEEEGLQERTSVREREIRGRTGVRKVMQRTRCCLALLTSSCFIVQVLGAELLSHPRDVFMESVNMRHVLRWSPPVAACSTVRYSVQFQGEFELHILNGSWENSQTCWLTILNECDLTADLASDSDYNLRVQAQCGGAGSRWTTLPRPFNREQTRLTVPIIGVRVSGTSARVDLPDLPSTLELLLTYWRNDQKIKVSRLKVPQKWRPYHLSGLQEGATYCLFAQVYFPSTNRSTSSEDQCFHVPDSSLCLLGPVTVFFALVLLVVLVPVLLWTARRFFFTLSHNCWHQEPLPAALIDDVEDERIYLVKLDHGEEHHAILVLEPSHTGMQMPSI